MPSARPRLSSNLALGFGIGVAVLVLVTGVAVIALTTRPAVPAAPSATTAPAPSQAAPDGAVAFRDDAAKQLDDMAKDLDDLVTTVAQNGFLRLYSNAIELHFNLAQLQAIAAPGSVATTWPPALDAIGAALDDLDRAITSRDGPTILGAIDAVRARVDDARGVASAAS